MCKLRGVLEGLPDEPLLPQPPRLVESLGRLLHLCLDLVLRAVGTLPVGNINNNNNNNNNNKLIMNEHMQRALYAIINNASYDVIGYVNYSDE